MWPQWFDHQRSTQPATLLPTHCIQCHRLLCRYVVLYLIRRTMMLVIAMTTIIRQGVPLTAAWPGFPPCPPTSAAHFPRLVTTDCFEDHHRINQAYDPNVAAYSAMLQSMYGLSIACWWYKGKKHLSHWGRVQKLMYLVLMLGHFRLPPTTKILNPSFAWIHTSDSGICILFTLR